MRALLLLAALPCAFAAALDGRQAPSATSSDVPSSTALLIVLDAPTATPTVCGNLTATWAWRLSDPGSELFTLQIDPAAGPATSAPPDIPGLTSSTAAPSASPSGPVTPGRLRRDVPVTMSTALLVAQGAFSWNPVAVPSGWYTLSAVPSNPAVIAVASQPFFVAQGASSACLSASSSAVAASSAAASSAAASSSSATSTPHHRGINAGAVAGAVLGGFALTAALALAAAWALRRRGRAGARTRGTWATFVGTPRSSSSAGHEFTKADTEMLQRDAAARAAVRALGLPDNRPQPRER